MTKRCKLRDIESFKICEIVIQNLSTFRMVGLETPGQIIEKFTELWSQVLEKGSTLAKS